MFKNGSKYSFSVSDRLSPVQVRQQENDKLRKEFARHANAFYSWLTETRAMMMEGSGTLEEQLAAVGIKVSLEQYSSAEKYSILV